MRSIVFLSAALGIGATAGAIGCSSRDDGNQGNAAAVTADEIAMAQAAQKLISGDNAHCNNCHTASRDDVMRWGNSMLLVAQNCLSSSPALTPAQRVACMSDDPASPSAPFSATKLGLLAAGANRLAALFNAADPSGARLQAFKQASMPMGDSVPAFTAEEFNTIMNWVFKGMPAFNEVFGGPPEPENCVENITPALKDHVTKMKTDGWGARLADASTPMFGCPAGANAAACLTNLPDITQKFANTAVPQTLRQLRALTFRTSYWLRSSADGRFTGYGLFTSAGIFDHAGGPESKPIDVDARYDPYFFPNNDGVAFAGTGTKSEDVGPIRVCRQNTLTTAATQSTPRLTLKEAGCSEMIDSVYESVGASLDGASFWMTAGDHVNDDGGNQITSPLEGFEQKASTVLVPMVSDGVSFKPNDPVEIPTPLEGDQILSPSGQLLITRFGSQAGHRGYHIRRVTTTTNNVGKVSANTEVIGTICGGGAKASTSFDERFVITHQYVDPAESPDLPANSSNIVLHDLAKGETVRITNMKAGQFAFSPHFRADGWIYFLVRDMNPGGTETLVASDAAVKRM